MYLQAKNGSVPIGNTEMDYIAFGKGKRHLIMIPGLGEGLQTVKGTALPFAWMYRKMGAQYRVHVFSRRNTMPAVCSTKDMADDIVYAMDALNIPSASIIGISLGGMIAQHIAIDYPQRVEQLILTVTLGRPNPTLEQCLGSWIQMVRRGDYVSVFEDTAIRSYTPEHLKKNLWMYRMTGRLVSKKRSERFIAMARAGITHTAFDRLGEITCPTLIIGGAKDDIVTGAASEELAAHIPGSELYIYPDYGHGLYEEAPDFLDRVLEFLNKT